MFYFTFINGCVILSAEQVFGSRYSELIVDIFYESAYNVYTDMNLLHKVH